MTLLPFPKISIITVSYNAAQTIERTIQSVLNQSYPNIEYIIIDGGSTDGTVEIIKKYQEKLFFWVSERDKGIYDAMNKGINHATGEFIGIINSDDWYSLETVKKVVEMIEKHKTVDVFCGNLIYYFSKEKQLMGYSNYRELPRRMLIKHPTCFIRASIYKKKQYSLSYKIAGDYDFLLWCFKNNYTFYNINHVLAYFTMNGISSSSSIDGCIEAYHIWREYIGSFHALIYFMRDVLQKKLGCFIRKIGKLLKTNTQ